jgi:hypothetical protein
MATKLSNHWLWGAPERDLIQENTEALESVEATVDDLKAKVGRQAEEIRELRATLMGLVEVLRKGENPIGRTDLEVAIAEAWAKLAPVPPPPPRSTAATDPYRGLPAGEPGPEEIAEAKALLKVAEEHHFAKRFASARHVYQELVDRFPTTKPALTARQQLDNLRGG